MNLILNNPYRVVGVVSNATARELQSRKGKISAYAKVGKEITSEYDFPFLSSLERSSTIIDKAFSEIEQNQNKVAHSLFWFVNLNSIDNTAIQHLISGNKEKAIEIWRKLTDGKEVIAKNFSAFNNIGTLYLLGDSKENLKQGIIAKIELIESEYFKDFVYAVADETFIIDTNRQAELFIDTLLLQLKDKYSTAEIITLFSDCNGTVQNYLSKKFTEAPVHKIDMQIEQAKSKRIKDKSNAYRFGIDLQHNVKNELILLKSILGAENLQYKIWADKVAKEILQCSIDYFNENDKLKSTNDYLEEALQLVKVADSIAVNNVTKGRIKDSISTLEGMKDRELNQAIEVLKSIKSAYEKNKNQILIEVKKQELSLGYGQSINWSRVNRMIEDSIDWNKVVELIKQVIPLRNIEKIKNSANLTKVTEYKSLVEFVLGKLSSYQKNQVKYLCYWKIITTTAPTKSKPTTSSSSDNGGCAPWVYWVVGIIIFIILIRACN